MYLTERARHLRTSTKEGTPESGFRKSLRTKFAELPFHALRRIGARRRAGAANAPRPSPLLASVLVARPFLALLLPATQEVARGPAQRVRDPAHRVGGPAYRLRGPAHRVRHAPNGPAEGASLTKTSYSSTPATIPSAVSAASLRTLEAASAVARSASSLSQKATPSSLPLCRSPRATNPSNPSIF